MCGTLDSRLYHSPRYALYLYPFPLLLSRYNNLLPLAVIALPSLPNLAGYPLYYLSRADDRTKQSPSTSSTRRTPTTRSTTPFPTPGALNSTTADTAMIDSPSITIISLFALVTVHPRALCRPRIDTLRPLAVYWSTEV